MPTAMKTSMLLVPSEQTPSSALKNRSLKTTAGLKTEAETVHSMKTIIYASQFLAIARPYQATTSMSSVILHANAMRQEKTKLLTQ